MLAVAGVALCGMTVAQAEDATTKVADTTEYNNWITLGVGSPFIDGNAAAFMSRQQMNNTVIGGVEDFHYEQNVGKKGFLEVNGHGIYDSHNYGADVKLSNPDLGYVKAGYEQFRTWYDGSGGYFSNGTNSYWTPIYDDKLAVNRGRAWFEAGLTMPDVPQITFRYEHQFRDGNKDSSAWGPLTTTSGTRRIVPVFLGIDEKRDSFALDLKQDFGKTTLTVGGRYEHVDNNDSRNEHWYPGSATTTSTADRYGTERDMLEEDLFSAHAVSVTRFNDKLKLALGGSFTTLDTDVSGSRIWGNSYDPVLSSAYAAGTTIGTSDRGFITGPGTGANVKQYIANLNLTYTPTKDIVIVPSFRIEKEMVDGQSIYQQLTTNAVLANAPLQTITVDRDTLTVTEALEARYAGFKNWSLYARAEWAQSCQDASEISTTNGAVYGGRSVVNDLESFGQKYTAGANWYPMRGLNMGGQYYYKLNEYRWDHRLPSADVFERGFETHDLNYRLTWRPLSELSFVTRYDFTLSKIDFKADAGPTEDSAKMTSHIISESINWTPTSRMYIQLNGSYAWDGALKTQDTSSYYTTNTAVGNRALPNLENGYFTGSAILGYALDEVTDLQLQYTFYKACNYDTSNYNFDLPFGTSSEEHSITATVSRQLNRRTKVSLKYGYFNAQNDTSGGNNDYDAHLIYATLQYKF